MYNKYIKYKKKYLDLKKLIGGEINILTTSNSPLTNSNSNIIKYNSDNKITIEDSNSNKYKFYDIVSKKYIDYLGSDIEYISGEYGIGNSNYVNIENKSKYKNLINYIVKNKLPCYFREDFDEKSILVIAYDNEPYLSAKAGGSLYNFILGLNYFKYNYLIIGNNQKWIGWTGRMYEYIECLGKLPENQRLIMSDARDVLINNTYETLLNKFIKKDGDKSIIFSTEFGCCVGPMYFYRPGDIFEVDNTNNNTFKYKKKKEASFNQNFWRERYRQDKNIIDPNIDVWKSFFNKVSEVSPNFELNNLNFGIHGGNCKMILDLYTLFDMQPNGEDDQHLASEIFWLEKTQGKKNIKLDYNQEIFNNTSYYWNDNCSGNVKRSPYYNELRQYGQKYLYGNIYKDESVNVREVYKKEGNYLKLTLNTGTKKEITSLPNFIQTPGKDWQCYNAIVKLLPYCQNAKCYYYYTSGEVK